MQLQAPEVEENCQKWVPPLLVSGTRARCQTAAINSDRTLLRVQDWAHKKLYCNKGKCNSSSVEEQLYRPFWIAVLDLVPVLYLSPLLNPVSRMQADSSPCKSKGQ